MATTTQDQTDFFQEIMPIGLSDELLNDLKQYMSPQTSCREQEDLWRKLDAEVDGTTQDYLQIFLRKSALKKNEYIRYNISVLNTIMIYKNGQGTEIFEELLKNVNIEQLMETLKLNCTDKQNKSCFSFVHNQLLPMVFDSTSSKHTLNFVIDLLLLLPAGLAYEHINATTNKVFKRNIIYKYIPNIDPVNPKSMYWWRQCKVLIHYCGQILHNEIELTNAILRVVETGFKTKTVEDRCGSYDCWKELIDNYNLDKKYIKNSKQIRLLIKPLKAKLSKNCQVSVKRFEAYANLIEKLENFSVPCIEDFLVFCFGPLSEDFNVTGNEHLLNPGRTIKEVFPQSTEILLKLLGHKLNKESCCLNKKTYLTDIYKIKQFLDSEILSNYATVFISCIRISSELTLQWTKDNNREIVINCLWSSFFRLLLKVPENGKRQILQTIQRNIQVIIKKCGGDKTYYSILKVILRSLLYYLDETPNSELAQTELVSPIIRDICELETKVPELSSNISSDFLYDFLMYTTLQPKFEAVEGFKNMVELSPSVLIYFLNYTSKLSTEDECFLESKTRIIDYLMSLITSNSNQCINYWKVATESLAFSALDLELNLLKKLVILLQSSPHHSSTVLDICWFLPRFSKKNGQEFYDNLLCLICKCLSLPTVKINKHQILANFKNFEAIRNKHNFKISENFFKCLEYLLKPHQVYEILTILKKIITGMDKLQKDGVPKGLRDNLLDLATNSNEEISSNALTLLTKLETDSKSSDEKTSIPIGQTARITTPIRLLGQEVESPHKIRGSFLNKTSKVISPKPANQMPVFSKKQNNLNDLSDKDFVVIDKEVKVDTGKLSRHQKEMLKKRRDNIPALYQDLTQSISQSLDSNESEVVIDVKERKVLEKLPSEDENKNEYSSNGIDFNKPAVQRALNVLKLDIVGGDNYQNLPKKRRKSSVVLEANDEKGKVKTDTPRENVIPRVRKRLGEVEEKRDLNLKKGSPGRKRKEDVVPPKKDTPLKRGRKPKNKIITNSVTNEASSEGTVSEASTEILRLPSQVKEQSFTTSIEVPSQESNIVAEENIEASSSSVRFANQEAVSETASADLFVLRSPIELKSKFVSPQNGLVETEGTTEDKKDEVITEDLIIPSSQAPLKKTLNNIRVSLFRCDFKDVSPETLSEQQNLCNLSFDNSFDNLSDTETLDPDYNNLHNKTSELDTQSMDITSDISSMDLNIEETPKKKKDDLACSPVTKETPNKNSVLMNDTNDISPIKIDKVEIIKTSPEESNNEPCISDELAVVISSNSRSAKLLNLLPQPVPLKIHKPLLESRNMINIASPKTDRIRKMMMNCEEQSKIDVIDIEESSIKLNGKDVLKFDREVPSPLATPKISILKRKFPDTDDDGVSPCAKRKRVNFSDPPITSEKIYFKEQGEKSCFKKGRRKSIIKSMSPKWDSIKSIQNQIDSLGPNGIAPLPESPPKNTEEENGDNEVIDLDSDVLYDEIVDDKEDKDVVEVCDDEPTSTEFKIANEIFQTMEKNLKTQTFQYLLIKQIERNLNTQTFQHLLTKQIEKHIDNFFPEERKRLVAAVLPKS